MKYIVKSRLLHDGREYLPGQVVELLEGQAAVMPWAVEAQQPLEETETPATPAPAKKRKE
jgi:hypothetical protein